MKLGRRLPANGRPAYHPRREKNLLMVDQHTYLEAQRFRKTGHTPHTKKKVLLKGKSQVQKIDAVLADLHLDTRKTFCILTNVIVPRREYAGEVLEVDAEFFKQVQRVQVSAAEKTKQHVFKVHEQHSTNGRTRNTPNITS